MNGDMKPDLLKQLSDRPYFLIWRPLVLLRFARIRPQVSKGWTRLSIWDLIWFWVRICLWHFQIWIHKYLWTYSHAIIHVEGDSNTAAGAASDRVRKYTYWHFYFYIKCRRNWVYHVCNEEKKASPTEKEICTVYHAKCIRWVTTHPKTWFIKPKDHKTATVRSMQPLRCLLHPDKGRLQLVPLVSPCSTAAKHPLLISPPDVYIYTHTHTISTFMHAPTCTLHADKKNIPRLSRES